MDGAFRGHTRSLTSQLLPFLSTSLSNRINAFEPSLRLQSRRLFSSSSFELNSGSAFPGRPGPSVSEGAFRCRRSRFAPARHANVAGAYKRFPTRYRISKCPSAAPVLMRQVHGGRFFQPASLFRAPASSRLIAGPRVAPRRRQSAAALLGPAEGDRAEPRKRRGGQTTAGRLPQRVPFQPRGWDVRPSAIFSSSLARLASRHSSVLQHE